MNRQNKIALKNNNQRYMGMYVASSNRIESTNIRYCSLYPQFWLVVALNGFALHLKS